MARLPKEMLIRAWMVLLFPPFIVIGGATGYRWIEGWDWLSSVYMTFITISTVGYGEVKPLSDGGKVFSMGLIMVSFGSLTYCICVVTGFLFEGEIKGLCREGIDGAQY